MYHKLKSEFKHSLTIFFFCLGLSVFGQDSYKAERTGWLSKAEESKPQLIETIKHPLNLVEIVKDSSCFQGWKVVANSPMDSLYNKSFKKINSVMIDFGEHLTGYFSFNIKTLRGIPDAPLRFKLTFGEMPSELVTPFDPFPGELSRAWLQDEVVTIMIVPATFTLERRIVFRYVKVELLGSSRFYDFKIAGLEFKAVTSVTDTPAPLRTGTDQIIRNIDKVGLNTLKECMQTVFEDVPKRDQRLWIGDLYLESLANSYSFKNYNLTKRCLYLLAGLSQNDGLLIGSVFENPEPHAKVGTRLMDYSFLYLAALKEYVNATNDFVTANDLWPIAKKQLDIVYTYLQSNGLMNYDRANKEWWLFFDWKDNLNKEAALQGLTIYTLKNLYELSKLLNKQEELKDIPALITKMSAAARSQLYNQEKNLFESGELKQISYASQIWMILGGVLPKSESRKTLRALIADKNAVYPGTPYLYHYFIQALINTGMDQEAKQSVVSYWGGMVKKGADTFWEVYDPDNDFISPYKFYPINSYCHAWSCTPAYFIRKYPEIFQ